MGEKSLSIDSNCQACSYSVLMGIDIQQYRASIGSANTYKFKFQGARSNSNNDSLSFESGFLLFYTLVITYFLPLSLKINLLNHVESKNFFSLSCLTMSGYSKQRPYFVYLIIIMIPKLINTKTISKLPSLTTFAPSSLIVMFHLFIKVFNFSIPNSVLYSYALKMSFNITLSKLYSNESRHLLYNIATLLLFLIVLSNMSLLNPGPERSTGLNCFFQNVQGFVTLNSISKPSPDLNLTKIMEFQVYVYEKAPDIIILNETWLKPSINSKELLPGNSYKIFRRDRSPQSHPPDPDDPNKFKLNGGGVLIAVKNSLNLQPKQLKSSAQAEILSVALTLPNKKKITVSTIYRVGTLGHPNVMEVEKHFYDIFRTGKFKYNIIVGDLNLDSANWHLNTASGSVHSSFLNLFNDLGLSQLISEPTHRSGNTLDVLLSNTPPLIENIIVSFPGSHVSSDHSYITFSIRSHIKRKKIAKRSIYNFKRANWTNLNNDLSRVDWQYLLDSTDVDTGWITFKDKFNALCDLHIPKIKIKDSFQPPWFDSEVFRLNKKKEHFRKLFKETNNRQYYKKFSSLRKELKYLIKSKMRSNFDDDLSPNTITKKFWSAVKSTSKSNRIPENMYLGNTIRNNPIEIANLFNQHFYNQFSEESQYDIDINFNDDQFFDLSFNSSTVYTNLMQVNPNKSPGPDNISGHLLKNCAQSICHPLSILFNISFRTGSFPVEWKMANIVPIYKKGDKNCIENYRPISLTSIISKIFEKCLRDEILIHCKDLIHETQHGFLPHKSCTTQLLPFAHDVSLGLNSSELIDIIYFDFAKAFDSVNHDIILHKLKHHFGIDGLMLKLIKEYLKDRKQCVVVDGKLSAPLNVKSGVPQGSILGPLLFVLFINDMYTRVSAHTRIALYADDTKIWRYIKSPNDHTILQSDINALNAWATENRMKFHPDKCKVLSVNNFHHNLFQELPFYLYPYHIHDTILDYTHEEKDLGILVTSKFSFKAHQNYILNRAINQFNLLRRTCHFVNNIKKRRTLYLTLIRSLFNHGSQMWSPVGSAFVPFETLQKRCIKWILKESYLSYGDIEYKDKLKTLEILPIEYYFLKNDLSLFFKIIHELVPITLPKEIVRYNNRTRSRSHNLFKYQLHESISNTKRTLSNSFFVRTMTHWNRLPDDIREIDETSMFTNALERHFWSVIIDDHENISESEREPD